MPLFAVNNNCPNLIASIAKKVFAVFRLFLDGRIREGERSAGVEEKKLRRFMNRFRVC
jgi:hypothetical protein